MEKIYRYQVVLNKKALEVTATTPFEALKKACEIWKLKWQTVVSDAMIIRLRQVKG